MQSVVAARVGARTMFQYDWVVNAQGGRPLRRPEVRARQLVCFDRSLTRVFDGQKRLVTVLCWSRNCPVAAVRQVGRVGQETRVRVR